MAGRWAWRWHPGELLCRQRAGLRAEGGDKMTHGMRVKDEGQDSQGPIRRQAG